MFLNNQVFFKSRSSSRNFKKLSYYNALFNDREKSRRFFGKWSIGIGQNTIGQKINFTTQKMKLLKSA